MFNAQISTNVRWIDTCVPEATVATHPGVSSASAQLVIATTQTPMHVKVFADYLQLKILILKDYLAEFIPWPYFILLYYI